MKQMELCHNDLSPLISQVSQVIFPLRRTNATYHHGVMSATVTRFGRSTRPFGLCRGEDLCGLYSDLSQDGKLVVEDIPLVVWGLCFGKVGGLYPSCLALSGGVLGWGHSVS